MTHVAFVTKIHNTCIPIPILVAVNPSKNLFHSSMPLATNTRDSQDGRPQFPPILQYHQYHHTTNTINATKPQIPPITNTTNTSIASRKRYRANMSNLPQLPLSPISNGNYQSHRRRAAIYNLVNCLPAKYKPNNTSLKATLKIIHGVICLFCDDKNQNSNPVFCFRPMAHLRPLREMMFSCILHCDLNSLLKIIHSTICLLGDNKNNNNNNNNKNNSDLDCHHNNQSCFLPSVHDHPAQHCDAIPQSSKYSLLLVITIISSIPQSSKFVFSL